MAVLTGSMGSSPDVANVVSGNISEPWLIDKSKGSDNVCSSSPRGRCAAGAGESWAYTLADLQSYLGQFPATHYSHGGREPLLYATVLLLSLQFRAAVAFLAQHPSARDYRVDAPHLAIALTHHQVPPCSHPFAGLDYRVGTVS